MSILEKEIEVTITSKVVRHYEQYNYHIPRNDGNKVIRNSKIIIDVAHLPHGSGILVTKICDNCGIKISKQKYEKVLKQRKEGLDYCKRCGTKIGLKKRFKTAPLEKSLYYLFPNLVKEWNYEKNEKNPLEVYASSNKKWEWICFECGSEYSSSPNSRTFKNYGCPYCSGQKVNQTNCLATTHPELIKEWNFDKNGDINPSNISSGSGKLVWLTCLVCESDYDTRLNRRIGCMEGCPYCRGMRVNHTNCLSTTHPELAIEWHPTKNKTLKPDDVTKGNKKKVWWLCFNCNNEFNSTTNSRTSVKSGCPQCAGSKGEKKIIEYLKTKNIKYEIEYKFSECRDKQVLPFDFVIFDKNDRVHFLVEYDGKHHYEAIDFFGGVEALSRTKEHDQIKNDYCIKKDLLLFRIPFWEYKNIETVLDEILRNLFI